MISGNHSLIKPSKGSTLITQHRLLMHVNVHFMKISSEKWLEKTKKTKLLFPIWKEVSLCFSADCILSYNCTLGLAIKRGLSKWEHKHEAYMNTKITLHLHKTSAVAATHLCARRSVHVHKVPFYPMLKMDTLYVWSVTGKKGRERLILRFMVKMSTVYIERDKCVTNRKYINIISVDILLDGWEI